MAARVTSRLEPPEHAREAAHPEHAQDLRQPATLDQVVGHPEDVLDRGPVQPLEQQRDEPADRRGLDRGVGKEPDPLAVELDEQIDRRLAFLDPMRGVLVRGQPFGQRRQALGEVEQRSIRSCRSLRSSRR